jgi:creatinine amidohydrolase/Fe(II)-dependent formamide hydrolase-like protein
MYRYLLLIAMLCFAGTVSAQTSNNILMERMTSYEIRDAIAAGKTTVILPSGGTEQNGPGMAIGKHNFRALANAQTIARRLGNALVAPVWSLPPDGESIAHRPYALSRHLLTEAVYAQVLEHVAAASNSRIPNIVSSAITVQTKRPGCRGRA